MTSSFSRGRALVIRQSLRQFISIRNRNETKLASRAKNRKPKIILASTSPYRKAQLKQTGLRFQCVPSRVNEELFHRHYSGAKLSLKLALEKAKAVASQYPEDIVIGADQLVSLNKKTLGKPGSEKIAIKMLQQMSGKTHFLHTSICMIYGDSILSKTITAKIRMRPLRLSEIKAYVQQDSPLDCAGSYKFEKSGLSLISKIEVSDPSSLIGLPLITLFEMLRELAQTP